MSSWMLNDARHRAEEGENWIVKMQRKLSPTTLKCDVVSETEPTTMSSEKLLHYIVTPVIQKVVLRKKVVEVFV